MLTTTEKAELTATYQSHATDTGSTEVQVAILTHRIKQLTDHLRANKKDHHSQRGLLKLVGRRRGLLRYLNRENPAGYKALIASLGLRR